MATKPEQVIDGEVSDFLHSRHPDEPERVSNNQPFKNAMAARQRAFGSLTLAEIGLRKRVGSLSTIMAITKGAPHANPSIAIFANGHQG